MALLTMFVKLLMESVLVRSMLQGITVTKVKMDGGTFQILRVFVYILRISSKPLTNIFSDFICRMFM